MGLLSVRERFSDDINKLTNEEAAYILTILMLILALTIHALLEKINTEISFSLYWFALIFMFYGFSNYVFELIKNLSSNLLGKSLGAIVFLGATTLNLAVANGFINNVLHVPASAFGYTQTLVSILTIPVSSSISFMALFVICLSVIMVDGMVRFKSMSAKNILTLKFITGLGVGSPFLVMSRIISIVILLSLSISFVDNNKWYSEQISVFTKWFAFNFEMDSYGYCIIPDSAKVSYLQMDNIVVGEFDGENYNFYVKRCRDEL